MMASPPNSRISLHRYTGPDIQRRHRPRPLSPSSRLNRPSRLSSAVVRPRPNPHSKRAAPPNTCPFSRFRPLEVSRRRPPRVGMFVTVGREPGGGLVVIPDAFTFAHRAAIISAAARNNVPAVSRLSDFARNGGLLSYGVDVVSTFRGAATYVDRILRGAKPYELPIHYPTKFEMAVNLKTAKALGLAVPSSIILRADEVIE
jgi:hypothetical protein